MKINWQDQKNIGTYDYICGNCGGDISSDKGYFGHLDPGGGNAYIYLCHRCGRPTFIIRNDIQIPGPLFGKEVDGIDNNEVRSLYMEARKCSSSNSFTASVLCCRKILMNIAVSKGAKQGMQFIDYVEYLSNKGYVPPDGKDWVDHIRQKGNEATHEIKIMESEDAKDLISFTEMLLKFIYEFPARIKKKEGE